MGKSEDGMTFSDLLSIFPSFLSHTHSLFLSFSLFSKHQVKHGLSPEVAVDDNVVTVELKGVGAWGDDGANGDEGFEDHRDALGPYRWEIDPHRLELATEERKGPLGTWRN